MKEPSQKTFFKNVRQFIRSLGMTGDIRLHALPCGGNNRVFRLESDNESFLFKSYFQHINDPRDRLKTEYVFSQFLWDNGVRTIPQPIAKYVEQSWGLYEFIEGLSFSGEKVTKEHVLSAADFFRSINQYRSNINARHLSAASGACFSMGGHIACIEQRVERVRKIAKNTEIGAQTQSFVQNSLYPAWIQIKSSLEKKLQNKKCSEWSNNISAKDRCLSPSDFGFHNAIKVKSGGVKFIDFEYAGWDDPAKMICDFFCQPEIPVPADTYTFFQQKVLEGFSNTDSILHRMTTLLPLYRIKWCCIMLNDFSSVGRQRRLFAKQDSHEERQRLQLQKVQNYFSQYLHI